MTGDVTAATNDVAGAHPPAPAASNTWVTPVPSQSARSRMTEHVVGILAVVGTAATVWLGLWVTPPDKVQGDLVRLVYLHPGVAWVALYLAFGMATVSSILYLWPRTRSLFWDRLAAASAYGKHSGARNGSSRALTIWVGTRTCGRNCLAEHRVQ